MQPKSQDLAGRGPPGQEHLPIHPDRRRLSGAEPGFRRTAQAPAEGAAFPGRDQRPAVGRAAGQPRGRSRRRLPPGGDARPGRQHPLRRLRPAPGRHHLREPEPASHRPRGQPGVPAGSRLAEQDFRAVEQPEDDSDRRRGQGDAAEHHVVGQPPGAVPGGDALLQSRPGLFAERCHGRDRRGRGRDAHAGDGPRQFPGHGAGVRGLARDRADPDPIRPGRGLSHPRHAL